MAEFVQANLEKMLTELEQLQRIQLLSNEEVKMVIKKRKKFEYKLQKRQKQKEDILSYIQYEASLLNLIAIRREQSKYTNKKNEIDYAIAKRINKLFRILEHRFSGDLMVWSSHIAWLKEMDWTETVGKVYRRMLQVHPDKVKLWIAAARFELEENIGNVENARTIYMEAMRFHPESIELLLESFCLELVFIQRLKEDATNYIVADENKDAILNGKVAEAICMRGIEACSKTKGSDLGGGNVVDLLVSMLHFAKLLGAGYPLQSSIIETLLEKFAHEPLTWKAHALLALFPPQKKGDEQSEHKDLIPSHERNATYKISEFCSRFEEGLVKQLPVDVPAKRQQLLNIYLESMKEVLDGTKDKKVYAIVAERIWYTLLYGKQNIILNEEKISTLQAMTESIRKK